MDQQNKNQEECCNLFHGPQKYKKNSVFQNVQFNSIQFDMTFTRTASEVKVVVG